MGIAGDFLRSLRAELIPVFPVPASAALSADIGSPQPEGACRMSAPSPADAGADADWIARRDAALARVAKAERIRADARAALDFAEEQYWQERIALALIDREMRA